MLFPLLFSFNSAFSNEEFKETFSKNPFTTDMNLRKYGTKRAEYYERQLRQNMHHMPESQLKIENEKVKKARKVDFTGDAFEWLLLFS